MKPTSTSLRARQLNGYICKGCTRQLGPPKRRYATATRQEVFDVVCVGGGPAGLSLLAALRMILRSSKDP